MSNLVTIKVKKETLINLRKIYGETGKKMVDILDELVLKELKSIKK